MLCRAVMINKQSSRGYSSTNQSSGEIWRASISGGSCSCRPLHTLAMCGRKVENAWCEEAGMQVGGPS